MALSTQNLSVLAYANGFTLWHYKAGAGKLDGICRPDFFNAADDMLTPGDVRMISAADGVRIVALAAGETGGVVTAPLS